MLSLPIVFHKCGVAFTTIAMIGSAGMTYMSLIMLVYCSRRGGGSRYVSRYRDVTCEQQQTYILCIQQVGITEPSLSLVNIIVIQ